MPFPSDSPAGPGSAGEPAVATATQPVDATAPAETEAPYQAPRTEAEELVASVFAQVLELDRVGVHDDLFKRGGNSLHAVQVISRINDATGLDVPVSLIFEHPTVAELTEALEKLAEASSS
jgi:acyl carrier protein